MLDDDSEENIEKIHLMGLEWWSRIWRSSTKIYRRLKYFTFKL